MLLKMPKIRLVITILGVKLCYWIKTSNSGSKQTILNRDSNSQILSLQTERIAKEHHFSIYWLFHKTDRLLQNANQISYIDCCSPVSTSIILKTSYVLLF